VHRPEFVEPAEPWLRSESYAQVVRTGDLIEISGQGGWTEGGGIRAGVREEIAQACDNVERSLRAAGASWHDVLTVHSNHVGDGLAAMSAELRRRMPGRAPAWTYVEVPMLGTDMHIEVRVTALRKDAMSGPEFFVTPGYGQRQLERWHYSQAVRVGNRIETSGQGGWTDDMEFPGSGADEIVRAFDNVERTLRTAGASWADVIGVNSYHTVLDMDVFEVMSGQLRARIPTHAPIWTCIGVTRLGHPSMTVEIRVTAIVDG
jgi:enamine deaminase RidA (YjgF/YER057c/UK114 family)